MKNPWDSLSEKFNTFQTKIDPASADNVEIAWPVITKFIRDYIPNPEGARALDFGCGTGMFCKELKTMGFNPTGIDTSQGMIDIAKKNLGGEIQFLVGDSKTALETSLNEKKYKLVTSIMVLQFIENIEGALKQLLGPIEKMGLITIVVHSPEYLVESKITNTITLGDTPVNIYSRSAEQYDDILKNFGFDKLLEAKPPFPKEFIEKYKPDYVTSVPEYLILGYQKS
jgi:predicted TPR repeat methyltransferase